MPRLKKHILDRFEKTGFIPHYIIEHHKTLHWCKDWEKKLIDDSDPEFTICTCFKKKDENET